MKKYLLAVIASFPVLPLTAAENITFVDPNVKTLCVANWDTSGDSGSRSATAAVVVSQKKPLKFGG